MAETPGNIPPPSVSCPTPKPASPTRKCCPTTANHPQNSSTWPSGDYQIVIADEAHHLRNVGTRRHDAVAEITTAGARKDMLLVTATPVNNSLRDLEHLLGLFLVSDDALVAKGISSWSRKVRDAIRMEERDDTVPEGFLYDLLDQVTVRRSRQFILDNPAAEGRHHPRRRRPRATGSVPQRRPTTTHPMGSRQTHQARRRPHGAPRRGSR